MTTVEHLVIERLVIRNECSAEVRQQLQTLINQGIHMTNIVDEYIAAQQLRDTRLTAAVAGVRGDIQALKDQIAQLNTTNLTPAQVTALQALSAQAETITTGLEAVDALTGPAAPSTSTTLAASYSSQAAFDAALAVFVGPETVQLDEVEVKAGNATVLAYFSHSATGVINTTGPTD